MVEDILKSILDAATGFDRLVIVVGVIIGIICWRFVGAETTEKDRFIRQLNVVKGPALIAIILIAINHLVLELDHSAPQKKFEPGVLGVLVLHIVGDNDGSLQREIVSNLNDKLATGTNSPSIEVWASDDSVEEIRGLMEAHDEARKIGERRNALFVIWGSKVGEARFSPRITLMNAQVPIGNRTLMEQDIRELINGDPTLATFFGTGTKLKLSPEKAKSGAM